MKALFLNLPSAKSVMRRYGCSYNSPGYLFPPLELCSAATALREWNGARVAVLDAVAERLDVNGVAAKANRMGLDLIVSLAGFDCFHDDMKALKELKARTGAATACLGYLPTLFPEETARLSGADYVILGEPEMTLSELARRMETGQRPDRVQGLFWRDGKKTVRNAQRPRIKDLDALPFPDRSLIDNGRYSMPFFGRPFTTMQTSRGCPFHCTYCTHFEGAELAVRSPGKVIEELEDVIGRGIRHVRFMDNNFTFPQKRTKEICRRMAEERLDVEWACMSRTDLLDPEMARLLRKAGCKTVFVGVESGSQRTLDRYRKGYKASDVPARMRLLKRNGMEAIGWFMFGAPWEDETDFKAGLGLAKSMKLDYAIASVLSFFPGTPIFEEHRMELDFSLAPFSATLKDMDAAQRAVRWEKRFYKGFYMRPGPACRMAKRMLLHPRDALASAKGMLAYLAGGKGDLF